MTRLSLFSRRSSSVQEIPLWGRPSLMSPLPAPDPTRQQWPNLVWKRATMGEPTGPLISWSPPPTHPTGQRGSSTHTEVHTDTRIDTHELSSCSWNNSQQRTHWLNKWLLKLSKNYDSNSLSLPFPLPILNPPSPPLHTDTHTPGPGPPSLPVWSSLISQLSFLCLSQGFLSARGPRF